MAQSREEDLLAAARSGDEHAFRDLVQPRLGSLKAHCYRMLGSAQDAEDSLQDTLLRAWQGLGKFEGASSISTWLYAIATNSCLTSIERRRKRLSASNDDRPGADSHYADNDPLSELLRLETDPDKELDHSTTHPGPDARYERSESVELAFVAAMQHLVPRQRAVLMLCDVLGFSVREAAEALQVTTASVASTRQRARRAVAERVPPSSHQATLRLLGDQQLSEVVDAYTAAWERDDIAALVAMLTDEAASAKPALSAVTDVDKPSAPSSRTDRPRDARIGARSLRGRTDWRAPGPAPSPLAPYSSRPAGAALQRSGRRLSKPRP